MKSLILRAGLLTATLFVGNVLMAGAPTPPPTPPGGAPIDAGAILLLVAGAALTIYKMYQRKPDTAATNI